MIRRLAPALVLASVLGLAPRVPAQRDPSIPHAQDRPPGPALSPEEAIREMTVPPGFRVELVASEPEIVNPVAMTFDERGRIWITESLEYPRQSAGPGPRPRQGPRRHRRRRQGRQVHRLRRGAEHPLGDRRRRRRRLGRQLARHPLPPGHRRRRQGRHPRGRRHRLRPRRHARAAQLADLGARRLALRLERRLQPGPVNTGARPTSSPARSSGSTPGPATSRSSARGRATPGGSPGTTRATPSPAPA